MFASSLECLLFMLLLEAVVDFDLVKKRFVFESTEVMLWLLLEWVLICWG